MPSRMEKYYQNDDTISRRTKKNQSLYDDIHNNLDYSEVGQISNANEISAEKLNELLNKNNKVQSRTQQREVQIAQKKVEVENNNYDINEALEKAKTVNSKNETDYHKLKENQINLLKKIQSYKASKQEQDENLNDLLNTIANTQLLKNLNDSELSLDLLGDLKSDNDNTMVGGIDSINRVINDVPKVKKDEEEINEFDKSFYTSSLSFNEQDFDEIKEIKNKLKKNNFWIRTISIILCVIVVIVIVLVIILL